MYRLIDLFSGAGGLSLGFSKEYGHNFEPVWANDFNDYAVETYNMNFGSHCVGGDIVDILIDPKTKLPKADVVIGGPPCQGFSLLNKNRDDDPRKHLWRPFLEVVKRSGAEIFVMENVPQLLGSPELEDIISLAKKMGFKTTAEMLLAADYGVPQTRYRAFIVGCKFADPKEFFPPKRTHFRPNNGTPQRTLFRLNGEYVDAPLPWRTVRDAITDLPPPKGTEIRDASPPFNLHFGRTPTAVSLHRNKAVTKEEIKRFAIHPKAPDMPPVCWIRKTKGGTDLFGRLWWDKPAYTIRTEFYKPEKGRYLHPAQHRPITHREAARFQTFPDWFKFYGTKIEIAKQIGNAVPPLLASRVANCVVELLAKMEKKRSDRQVHVRKTKPHYVAGEELQHTA